MNTDTRNSTGNQRRPCLHLYSQPNPDGKHQPLAQPTCSSLRLAVRYSHTEYAVLFQLDMPYFDQSWCRLLSISPFLAFVSCLRLFCLRLPSAHAHALSLLLRSGRARYPSSLLPAAGPLTSQPTRVGRLLRMTTYCTAYYRTPK
jgi:hypothetical protein